MNRTSMPRLLTAAVGIAALSAFMPFGLLTVSASAQTRGSAKVRVAHFSPDTPGVDVYLDGKRAVGNMGYRTVTDYLSVPGGDHQLALRPSGAPATSPAVLTGEASFDGGKAYTVAGLGPRAELHAGVFVDEEQAPPAGKANVRFIHAVVGANAVNVVVGDDGATPFGATMFGAATDYEPVAPGSYKVSLEDTSGKTLLQPTAVEFAAGLTYTIAGIGGGDAPVRILPVVDQRAAATAPAGGVATGAGGTAVRPHASSGPWIALVAAIAVGMVGALLVRTRRRRVV